MKSPCDRLQSLIPDAVQNRARGEWPELEPALQAQVYEHAAECAQCRSLLGFYSGLLDERAAATADDPPPVYFEGLLAELHRKLPAPRSARLRQLRRPANRHRMASTAAMLLFGGWCTVAAWSFRDRLPTGVFRNALGAAGKSTEIFHASQAAPRLIVAEGIGLVSEDSALLTFTHRQLQDLGYVMTKKLPSFRLATGILAMPHALAQVRQS